MMLIPHMTIQIYNMKGQEQIDTAQQQIIDNYTQFFGGILDQVRAHNLETVPRNLRETHRINVIQPIALAEKNIVQHGNIYIEIKQMKNNGLECTYEAIVGQFFLIIKMLNIPRNAESDLNPQASIGKGNFGIVKELNIENKKIAIKKISFESNIKKELFNIPHLLNPEDCADPFGIRFAIREYCIYKICSMLKIGPQIIFTDVYDLVCYNDCIEFQMELCQTVDTCKQQTFEKDLKYCLAMLHQLKFVHKDIKPPNILYSPSLQRYVLTDFGISNSVKENLWEQTETYFQGSFSYASQQMKDLFNQDTPGFVNMYINDVHALKIAIRQITNQVKISNENFSRNSMSIIASQNESYNDSYMSSFNQEESENSENRFSLNNSEQTYEMVSAQTYGQSTLQSSNQQMATRFSNQLNFYLIKSLFKIQRSNSTDLTLESVKQILEEVCAKKTDQKILQTLNNTLYDLLFPKDPHQKHILNIRNHVRIFGIYSSEVIQLFSELLDKKYIPFLNYNRLKNVMNSIKLQKNWNNKKVSAMVCDLQRHMVLLNYRSLANSIQYLLKQYRFARKQKMPKDQQFVEQILMAFDSDSLKKQVVPDIIEYFEMFLGHRIQKSGRIQEDLIKIIQELYHYFGHNDLLSIENELRFFRAFFKVDRVFTKQTLKKIAKSFKQKSQEYQASCTEPLDLRKHKYINFGLQLDMKLEQYEESEDTIEEWKQKFKKIPLWKVKFQFFDNAVIVKSNLQKYQQSRQFNEYSYQLKREYYFPKQVGPEITLNYFHFAVVAQYLDKDIDKAIYFYKKIMENMETSFSFLFAKTIVQSCNNLCICLEKQNKLEDIVFYVERCYKSMLQYSICTPQDNAYLLDNLVRVLLRLNRKNQVLYLYIDQLVSIKHEVARDRLNAQGMFLKQLPLYKFVGIQECHPETLVFAKKMFILSIEPYLPTFLHFYCNICDDLTEYYIKKCKQPVKALPYLWKFFSAQSKVHKDQFFYEKLNIHIDLLIRSNSMRRALKVLKVYTFLVDDEYQKYRRQFFRKLAKLSKQLETRDKVFYNWVWKQKAFQSFQTFNVCMNRFKNIRNQAIKICYIKLMKKLMPAQLIKPNTNNGIPIGAQSPQQSEVYHNPFKKHKKCRIILKQCSPYPGY